MFFGCSSRSAGCAEHSERRGIREFHSCSRALDLAELGKHLQRSAATLDSFISIKDEIISNGFAEAAERGTVPMDAEQVNLVKGKVKRSGSRKCKGKT